jgi:hypothetical protein
MPLNLLKIYNQLLDLGALNPYHRQQSLMGVFTRDFADNPVLKFKNKLITPTPADGVITMETLFNHLTTQIVDERTRRREFELHRSLRLHWVRFHIDERKADNMLIFSVKEPDGIRTYIYDKDEKYVVVLEPLRDRNSYYLLTAYHVMGKDAQRDKFAKKYKRKLSVVL